MTTFFTSDLHFYHSNIIKYCARPFNTVEEMNEVMVNNWNAVVKPEDTVYCIGDFSLAWRPVEVYTPRLNGKKYLVPGNHDFCHSHHPKSRSPQRQDEWIQKYEDHGWIVLPERNTISLAELGAPVNLCHLPYVTKETDLECSHDKFAKYRMKDDGKWLLCGHIHEKWKVREKMINVGVDVWNFAPVSAATLAEIISPPLKEVVKDE